MNRSVSFKPAGWAMAALTAAVIAGCGGGGGDSAPAAAPVTPPAATGPNTCSGGTACVNLATAANYAILAQTAITSTATPAAVTGDLGLSLGAKADYTGFTLADDASGTFSRDAAQVTGKIFADDHAAPTPGNLTTASADASAAFTDASTRTPATATDPTAGTINSVNCGLAANGGIYQWTTAVHIQSDCVLTGGPDDVWIFQIGGALDVDNSVQVTMAGGAQAKNVFWAVSGAATIHNGAHLDGIVLSSGAISMEPTASSAGRLLSGGAVALDGNTVVQP